MSIEDELIEEDIRSRNGQSLISRLRLEDDLRWYRRKEAFKGALFVIGALSGTLFTAAWATGIIEFVPNDQLEKKQNKV